MRKFNWKNILGLFWIIVLALTLVGCKDTEDDGPDYTVDDLESNLTDSLKLEESFKDKSFLTSGIEEVGLLRLVDGDTTHFVSGRTTLKIRYLGINTPESTSRIAPWGKQASKFVADKLENAVSIVIEAEEVGKPALADSTGDRYLAYVWYKPSETEDYRLLNLEIIENCFSFFSGERVTKYGSLMYQALEEKRPMKLRVFGEKDPNFDYSTTIHKITIHELRNSYSSYSTGSKLKVEARVIRLVGNSLYVEDLEDSVDENTGISSKSGMFVYHSFVPGIGDLKPGMIVEFECQASDEGNYGMQLVYPNKVKLKAETSEYTIRILDNTVTSLKEYEGFVVKLMNFLVTEIYTNKNPDDSAYTIYGTLENGTEVQIRIDRDVSPPMSMSIPEVGKKYNVIGGVSKFVDVYDDNKVIFQLKLGNYKYDGVNDFQPVD